MNVTHWPFPLALQLIERCRSTTSYSANKVLNVNDPPPPPEQGRWAVQQNMAQCRPHHKLPSAPGASGGNYLHCTAAQDHIVSDTNS